tara:strand:- start:426 stop:1226 length:801 start_codon:yes stop_codon:yes gene_type:complete
VLQKYDTLRYFIELSYFGKPYNGWQKQPNAPTVQQTIEEALSTILREPLTIMGAGRTDTGVHASQMFAHVDIPEAAFAKLPDDPADSKCSLLTKKLNSYLPPAIAIKHIFQVAPEAHTRFDAIQRSYRYRIAKSKDPFTTDLAFQCRYDLDVKAMNDAAAILLTYTDFECFSKSNTAVNTYLCTISEARWIAVEDELHFIISADRFLRNMVRAIVGTLIEIGQAKHEPSWMHEVIKSKNRNIAGTSVPAHGLYLTRVSYPESIVKQ